MVDRWIERMMVYGRMIRFSHTVFALPFALSAVILAQREHPIRMMDIFWILVAMVGARSAAMGFNRIADAGIDLKNPRTANREIPTGKLSEKSAWLFVISSSGVFVFASAMLADVCFYLSFPVLAIILGYSYSKRISWLCHLYLGFAISLAPLGAWIAIAKDFSWRITLLSFALMTYIAGFDVLYACQDTDFDKREGLFSIPVRFGMKTAMHTAALLHGCSFLFFCLIFNAFGMNPVYLISVLLIGVLFLIEHHLVNPNDLSRIDIAFFHVNSAISVILFVGVLGDEILRRWR